MVNSDCGAGTRKACLADPVAKDVTDVDRVVSAVQAKTEDGHCMSRQRQPHAVWTVAAAGNGGWKTLAFEHSHISYRYNAHVAHARKSVSYSG